MSSHNVAKIYLAHHWVGLWLLAPDAAINVQKVVLDVANIGVVLETASKDRQTNAKLILIFN